jgi:hypothetical protein
LCLDKYTTWSELLLPVFSFFSHEFGSRLADTMAETGKWRDEISGPKYRQSRERVEILLAGIKQDLAGGLLSVL